MAAPSQPLVSSASQKGLTITPYFVVDPPLRPVKATVNWTQARAEIRDYATDKIIFEQSDLEFPAEMSQTAINVIAQKYFKGRLGTPEREWSFWDMILRVTTQICDWGKADGYFRTSEDAKRFERELQYLLLTQRASFNSPVWFNVGVPNTNGAWCWNPGTGSASRVSDDEHKPQCAACFILGVNDTMEDILQWYVDEGLIFANGSGSGVNLSKLRASIEPLSGGGKASGPVSFMRAADANAGTIKSGGKTRRAAKMVILNVDHPDIEEFIWCKAKQEDVAHDLISTGKYAPLFDVAGGAYDQVWFQNANNSVRVTDEFMQAVENDAEWPLKAVKTGEVLRTVKARHLLRQMAEAAHRCGDPGIQFDTTINTMNMAADFERINASNPCSEYMFLDDSACNLASLNLMKFLTPFGDFDVPGFHAAVRTMILAQEILVDHSGYPTKEIAVRSHQFRPLGLGFANLGAFLMAKGLAYDSPEARTWAGAITALMTGTAYATSGEIAQEIGAFPGYVYCKRSVRDVIASHRRTATHLMTNPLSQAITQVWNQAQTYAGQGIGFRNAQTTVLAPTGTIGFMMDCDTTGIEPELSLKKVKQLVGGGQLQLTNNTVARSLQTLGYSPDHRVIIMDHISQTGSVEGAPGFNPEHLPVFDTSLPAGPSQRSISWKGHLGMMAACQPFLSGAISKTINMPEESTVDDIMNAYKESWSLGLKSVAIYRNNCKKSQPLSTVSTTTQEPVAVQEPPTPAPVVAEPTPVPVPEQPKLRIHLPSPEQMLHSRLPDERNGYIHKFSVGGHTGYLTIGLFENGAPAEIFVDIAKEGTTISGLLDAFAISISFNLQYGVPLEKLVRKFRHMKFEPAGITKHQDIRFADSIVDYIFRYLEHRFLKQTENGVAASVIAPPLAVSASAVPVTGVAAAAVGMIVSDAPFCSDCGAQMVRSGSCHRCPQCGTTTGCS